MEEVFLVAQTANHGHKATLTLQGSTLFVNGFVVFCPFCRAVRSSGTPHDRAASTPRLLIIFCLGGHRIMVFL